MKKQLKEVKQELKELKQKQEKTVRDKVIDDYYKSIKPGNIPSPHF
jgi:hypothetical protein